MTPNFCGVGPAFGDDGVDGVHEVVEVIAGIIGGDDVGEALAVGGGAAGVGVVDDVAAGGHDEHFVIEDPAVSGVGAAVDVENHGVLFGFVEVRWELDEGVDREEGDVVRADGGGDVQVLRQVEIELGEESVVDVGEEGLVAGGGGLAAGFGAGGGESGVDTEEVAEEDGVGDEGEEVCGGGDGLEAEDGLAAGGDVGDFAGNGIDRDEEGGTLEAGEVIEGFVVWSPGDGAAAAAAGGGVVAAYA